MSGRRLDSHHATSRRSRVTTDSDSLRWSSSASRRTVHPRDARTLVGTELFSTSWRRVNRDHLDGFHWSVDEVDDATDMSANAGFPRGDDNVDGFMLMSLVTSAFFSNYPIGGDGLVAWNYGVDALRFPATVYLEDRFRMRVTLEEVTDKTAGWLLRNQVTIDLEGTDRPAMSAHFLVMLSPRN